MADSGTTCASDGERAGTLRMVTPRSLQSAGRESNLVGSLNGFQYSSLLGPVTAIAPTPYAFSHVSESLAPASRAPVSKRIAASAFCWLWLVAMLHEPPVNCGTSV